MTKITINKTTPTTSINTSTIAHLTSPHNDFDSNDPESVAEESKSSVLIYEKAGPELAANYKIAKGYVGPVMAVDSHNLKTVSTISKIITIYAPCIAPDHPETELHHDYHPCCVIKRILDLAEKLNRENERVVSVAIPLDFLEEKNQKNVDLCVGFVKNWIEENPNAGLETVFVSTAEF